MHRCLVPIVIALFAGAVSAQIMSAEISPQSAQPGQNVTLTISPNQTVTLLTGCAAASIRDDINGNPVTLYGCPFIIVTLPPCGTYTQTWDQQDQFGSQVPPGTYWFEVRYSTATGQTLSEWFCFRLEAAGSTPPTLTPTGPLQTGTTTIFDITSPNTPGAFYIMLASLTTNVGIPFGADRLCLDDDFVLGQTFPGPNPAAFTNFQGFLDGTGFATGIGVTMPNVPGLQCVPFHTQALVFDFVSNSLSVTNGVSHTIL